MASNLTNQVRDISSVARAVARGDLTQQITVSARGEVAELADTINTMTETLRTFADEVTRVAREVGTEGRLGGQAKVVGVSGTWKALTDSVNSMADNLTAQVRDIAAVTTAVANGDLSQKITVDVKGELLALKNTVNTMVDQLSAFADEVTRVAREVGTEGKLGGQAQVRGVSGTWKDLTDNVNSMAGNLTGQVRSIAQVSSAVARGDLSQKITVEAKGEVAALADTINTMVDTLRAFAAEVTRVAREVGTEGRLGGQADVRDVSGTWKDLTESVNVMARNLTDQVRNIAQVTTAVARGDLSQKITVDARGEILELKTTINTMVDQLSAFADEVTRVAREVGTEGKLGGQAQVRGVSGTWKDLTDNVNSMAGNLTSQVRSIALVTTAVARGDLSQKITVDARGEILELKTTINTMVDQLSAFTAEVTRVAREVGTEGRLGGQAEVEGVSGTWRKLTQNVNQLAGTLTTQLRAIAEVATAVTRGDLSREIAVEASGEVAELKDGLNQMILNLRQTTRANQEQDWLKTNLARITGLMQGRRDLLDVASMIMSELTPVVSAQHGAFFLAEEDEGTPVLRLIATYGYRARRNVPNRFAWGESLVGQAAVERQAILVTEAPPDYIRISSGLGEAPPVNLVVLPVLFEGRVLGVIELASFARFSAVHQQFLDQLMETVGVSLNAIMASSRTEELLAESQRLAAELQQKQQELQVQQDELQQTNAELEDKATLLAEQNRAIEIQNSEIEEARRALEERAEQLALSSRYKSEFLANMSHELRTPLNSLLILAKLLSDNREANLTAKQVEFARTIYTAGSDLLQLINDILDLSKVEAGKMDVHPRPVDLHEVVDYVQATFRPLTLEKGLDFDVELAPGVPAALHTDEQRLQQILRNLLSNAVKFSERGGVRLRIFRAQPGRLASRSLQEAGAVVGFAVTDTGIGIPADKLRVVFEAFQQADGTTSRRYGGTGLGLSISREMARLLGGEIHAESRVGQGSTFTLYLPEWPPETPEAVGDPATGQRQPAQPAGPVAVIPAPVTAPALGAALAEVGASLDASVRRLLVVEDDEVERAGIARLVSDEDVAVTAVGSAEEALDVLDREHFDGMVLDLKLPGASGFSLLEEVRQRPSLGNLPVIVYTGKDLTRREEARLRKHAGRVIVKDARSPRRLLDETSLLLHRAPAPGTDAVLTGRRVLIVDDDVRNVFALTSALEERGLQVRYAENGKEGLDQLQQHPDVDVVLVDLMMPEMDGYATMRAIRAMPQFVTLPIVAVTAKAMKGDRDKSLAAGASEHVTKPVDVERLLTLLRGWLGG